MQNLKPETTYICNILHNYKISDAVAMLPENYRVYIAGGACLSAFTESKVNDADLYVNDWRAVCLLLHALTKIGYKEVNKSINCTTLMSGTRMVQVIHKFFGEPEDILREFDFTITQILYDIRKGELHFGDRFFGDLAKREIVFTSTSNYPICALYRTLKYRDKGYEVKGYTMMLLALAISRLEMKTYKDLKDQLMGVDTMLLQGIFKDDSNFREDLPIDYGKFIAAVFEEKNLL